MARSERLAAASPVAAPRNAVHGLGLVLWLFGSAKALIIEGIMVAVIGVAGAVVLVALHNGGSVTPSGAGCATAHEAVRSPATAPSGLDNGNPIITLDRNSGACVPAPVVLGKGFAPNTPLIILVEHLLPPEANSPESNQYAEDSMLTSGPDGTFRQPLSTTFEALCQGSLITGRIQTPISVTTGPGRLRNGSFADYSATTAKALFTPFP